MVWEQERKPTRESEKIKFELIPYLGGYSLEIGETPVFSTMKTVPAHPNPDVAEGLENGSFDTVFSSHVLNNLDSPGAALSCWWEWVKPGGVLILYLPHRELVPEGEGMRCLSPEEVLGLMQGIGSSWDLEENQIRNCDDEYSFFQVYRKLAPGQACCESWKKPRPAQRAGVVRLGGYGDALWTSSVAAHLKDQGYHVTVYTQAEGEEVLRSDPHVDRIIKVPAGLFPGRELVLYALYESGKYERFVDLLELVESRLLPSIFEAPFHWPDEVRRE